MVGFGGSCWTLEYEGQPETPFKKGKTFKKQLETFMDKRGKDQLFTVLLMLLGYSEGALKMKMQQSGLNDRKLWYMASKQAKTEVWVKAMGT